MTFEKISLTAKLTAYMRQFSDIPFAKDIAQAVHAQAAFDDLLRTHHLSADDLLWYAPIFEVRYKSIAQRLRASGIEQVLELASGLSLRGLAMTEANPALSYVETDLEALTVEKRALLAELRHRHGLTERPEHPSLRLGVANALELPQLLDAVAGLRRDRPLAIVSEGLLQYLSPQELEGVAENVPHLAGYVRRRPVDHARLLAEGRGGAGDRTPAEIPRRRGRRHRSPDVRQRVRERRRPAGLPDPLRLQRHPDHSS